VLPERLGGYVVGVLVQSNFGGVLQILGMPVGKALGQYYLRDVVLDSDFPGTASRPGGSIMIVVATDAPLSDRNLERLARRALAGLARTGASMSNGSGDYVIAFSVAEGVRRTAARRAGVCSLLDLPNGQMSPLFQSVIEATEEAIYNSLFVASTVTGYQGHIARQLPVDRVLDLLQPSSGVKTEI
jgi:D-aminopeptidase